MDGQVGKLNAPGLEPVVLPQGTLLATLRKRPDLLARARVAGVLSADELRFLEENSQDTLY